MMAEDMKISMNPKYLIVLTMKKIDVENPLNSSYKHSFWAEHFRIGYP